MPKKSTKDVKEKLLESRREPELVLGKRDYLSTSSSLLNLGCSGRVTGGIPKGTIVHFVGDSDSGKTFFGMSLFAEAANNPAFDDFDLVFWNAEDGAMMDRNKFFGKKATARIEEEHPEILEDFYFSIDDRFKSGRPFVGVVDSMDVLTPKSWVTKFAKQKAAARSDREESGDYGMAKAKINSENLRRVRGRARKNGSILIMISQARDKVGQFGYGDTRTVAGGRVLKYYSALQIWTQSIGTIRKDVAGKPRAVGISVKADIKKNHITGTRRQVVIPILNDLGIDDVGSCVDYLVEEEYWRKIKKKGIAAKEFTDDPLFREALIRHIETGGHIRELRQLVKTHWTEIEEGCQSGRSPRYE